MEQEVTHSRGGCNSRHALNGPGEMTSMVDIYIEDRNPALRYRMLSVPLEYMGFLVKCTGNDGFLRPNVTNFYQQHTVWIQEMEVV